MKIDATDKILGRLASEIAKILQGKHMPDYNPRESGKELVEVGNISRIKVTGKKAKQKIYYRFSGYPGGMKKVTLEELFKKNPNEVLRIAVFRMLPRNRLRKERIKRLKIVL